MAQYLSQSIIHPAQEWSWSQRNVWFCGGVRVHIIIDDKLVIYGFPRSYSQHFTRFPLLRRTLVVNVPFWVVWWAGAHYRSPRSWLLLIPRAQRYLTFRSDFPFWCNRGKHVRIPYAASRDQIHHRLRFCGDSLFTCTFWRSLRNHFKTIGGTEMANGKQAQQMIPFITCGISLCQYVCELVLGVNVFDLDLGGPIWFYRITNQEQLCGFWKHVSLWTFFPSWSSWSLLRCLQTHTTKLPDEKN